MTKSRNIRAPRRAWTTQEDAVITARYPNEPSAAIARDLGRCVGAVYQRAQKLGLGKSDAFFASDKAGRIQRGKQHEAMRATHFPKGHVPANKGLRRPGWAPGRMAQSQFKKGERRGVAVRLWQPIGTERISKDGYLERKVNDDLPLQARWRAVHRIVWEATNGPVPPGHAVTFLPGRRTTDSAAITLDALELVSRQELMRRNTRHRLPKELADLIAMKAALTRRINKRQKEAAP